jgi:hypothetical protein|tara:strand:- start:1647 stop:2801 length:1155 start_codon:yes stop_codon:yes gene_type:complete
MVTETRTLPAEFIEALGKTYADTLTKTAGTPATTTDVSGSLVKGEFNPAETQAEFDSRKAGVTQSAREFDLRKQQMSGLAPQVAGMDQLQTDAITKATGAQGLGSYQQYLTDAGTAAGDAATTLGGVPSFIGAAGTGLGAAGQTLSGAAALTGTGAGTGTGSIASYMSPYQQQVIDTTLTEFDRQAQIQKNAQSAAALGTPGAFGGGREGVLQAEYASSSDRNRAATQAGLLSQGFQQASSARQADLQNRSGIASQQAALAQGQLGLGTAQQGLAQSQLAQGAFQQGLGGFAQQAAQNEISGLGTLGGVRQAQAQAGLDATRTANEAAVYEPLKRTGFLGQGVTGLMGGYGTNQYQFTDAPSASPLSSALQIGTGLASIYGNLK